MKKTRKKGSGRYKTRTLCINPSTLGLALFTRFNLDLPGYMIVGWKTIDDKMTVKYMRLS